MIYQKSRPVETGHKFVSSASRGPLKNMDVSSPHKKRTLTKYTKRLEAFRALTSCYGPYGTEKRVRKGMKG